MTNPVKTNVTVQNPILTELVRKSLKADLVTCPECGSKDNSSICPSKEGRESKYCFGCGHTFHLDSVTNFKIA